ncbi:PAS domain S-box protein [Prolixibacteraceae bacterium JC049]|nr:PAS domain S-box protein [Prolixibacteraceae bacterium JC049]
MSSNLFTINQILKRFLLVTGATILFVVIVFIVLTEYFQKQKQLSYEKQLVEDEKKMFLSIAVDNIINYLNYNNASADKEMRKKLKQEVDNALRQAQQIYDTNKNSKSKAEITELIKSVLREVRYFEGRGYIYIISMDGTLILHPYQKEKEGTSLMNVHDKTGLYMIKEQVKLMKQQADGFINYPWTKPWLNDTVFHDKLSYVKRFEPLNCFFGCGEYASDHMYDTQQKALSWLRNSYDSSKWNLFINHFDGTALVINSVKYKPGVNIRFIADNNGLNIFEKELAIAQSGKADFLYYNWPDSINSYTPKVAYVAGFPGWNWMIGASMSLEKIEDIQLKTQKEFSQISIFRSIAAALSGLFVLLIILRITKRFGNNIDNNFKLFSNQLEEAVFNKHPIPHTQYFTSEFNSLHKRANELLQKHLSNIKALTESEEKFRILVDSAPLCVVGIDNEGVIKIWNKQSELFFEIERDQVINQKAPLDSIFKKEQSEEAKANMFVSNSDFQLYPMQLKSGKTAYQYWASFQLSDDLLVWIGNDVTRLKEIENELIENRNFLNSILDNIPSPVFYKDINGLYQSANKAFLELINRTEEETIGKGVYDMYNKELADIYFAKDQEVFEGHYQQYDAQYGETPETYRQYTFYKAPVRNINGEVQGLIGVMLDITERIEVEKQLKELNATKDKFFSIIAHDLINPFNSMINIGELLCLAIKEEGNEELKEMSTMLNTATKRGYDLLLNLLEWSRSQTGRIQFSPTQVNVQKEVDDVVSLLIPMAENKKIALTDEIDNTQQLHCDLNMLKTIVRNLVSNAIKFTPEEGDVTITGKFEQDFFHLIVKDTGVGMNERTRNELFKLDKSTSSKGTKGEPGTGLGMVLVSDFVARHKGHIEVKSELKKGTQIHIRIPLS